MFEHGYPYTGDQFPTSPDLGPALVVHYHNRPQKKFVYRWGVALSGTAIQITGGSVVFAPVQNGRNKATPDTGPGGVNSLERLTLDTAGPRTHRFFSRFDYFFK